MWDASITALGDSPRKSPLTLNHMKRKLFGIALMLVGFSAFCWIAILVLLAKGMTAILAGIVFVAGWLIFNVPEESPKGEAKPKDEIVTRSTPLQVRIYKQSLTRRLPTKQP